MKTFIIPLLFIIFTFFTGCAPKQAMIKADTLITNAHYKEAALFSQEQIDKSDPYARNNLLWQLQTGYSYLLANEINASTIKYFDDSEFLMKHYREQLLSADISQTLTSTLLNDTTRPYIGREYDGVMVNTYKALEYMKLGDTNSARVEFNRAMDRQRRAKIFFSEMIKKEQDAIHKKEIEAREKGQNVKVPESEIDKILNKKYSNLHNFEAYPDFVNPMSTYLAGVFAKADNNPQKAETLLKEAVGMMPNNSDVKKDLLQNSKEPMVWVIFENGLAPVLVAWRLDFPIWIFTDKISYISVALPRLIERKKAYEYFNIAVDDTTIKSSYLCSMESVIKSEFEKNYPAIVRRAILSAATKTALNYTLQESSKNSGNATQAIIAISSAIYQISSTQADTRIWTSLPKEFQLARFKRPKNGKVTLKSPSNKIIKTVDLPKSDNILLYVKVAKRSADASVLVIPF